MYAHTLRVALRGGIAHILKSTSPKLMSSRLLMNDCFLYLSSQQREREVVWPWLSAQGGRQWNGNAPYNDSFYLFKVLSCFFAPFPFSSPPHTCEENSTKRFMDSSVPLLLFQPSVSLLPLSIPHLFPERLVHHHLPAELNPLSVCSPLHE